MEIRRFGVGNRRPDGPPGSIGVRGQVVHSDAAGLISELAFTRQARIEPHANPSDAWLLVIEGGGWVQVGDEQARVAAGEAVRWPAGIVHCAWTDHSEMRVFVVEFAATGPGIGLLVEGSARHVDPDEEPADPGEGHLTDPGAPYDPESGEPR
jgi:quercetin dioxygenase-like cupin family protein